MCMCGTLVGAEVWKLLSPSRKLGIKDRTLSKVYSVRDYFTSLDVSEWLIKLPTEKSITISDFYKLVETEFSLVTELKAGRLGFESWLTKKEISPPKSPVCLWSPDSLIFNGNGSFSQRVKRLGRQVHRFLPSSGQVKEGCCSSCPLYNLIQWRKTLLWNYTCNSMTLQFFIFV